MVWANLSGDPERVARRVQILREHCDKVGRPFKELTISNYCWAMLGKDEAEVKRKLARLAPVWPGPETSSSSASAPTPAPGRSTAPSRSRTTSTSIRSISSPKRCCRRSGTSEPDAMLVGLAVGFYCCVAR